jgi:hypothetical protein
MDSIVFVKEHGEVPLTAHYRRVFYERRIKLVFYSPFPYSLRGDVGINTASNSILTYI